MKAFNRIVGAIAAASLCAGVYFVDAPRTGESSLAYILREPPPLSAETLFSTVLSIALVLLFMANTGNER